MSLIKHRLLDSRWVEQREKHVQEKMAEENVYAAGTSIEASLKQLAERRTDIFGVGDEETTIGKKIGEEDVRKDDKVTWDGHSSSIEATTRAASSNISIEEQIHQIHKVKGLLTDDDRDKIGPKSTKSATNIVGNKMPVSQVSIHLFVGGIKSQFKIKKIYYLHPQRDTIINFTVFFFKL